MHFIPEHFYIHIVQSVQICLNYTRKINRKEEYGSRVHTDLCILDLRQYVCSTLLFPFPLFEQSTTLQRIVFGV